MRAQKPGNIAEEYIRSLHELANTWDFSAAKDENIHDSLVIGIQDQNLSEKLQLLPDLTLRNAVHLVKQDSLKKSVDMSVNRLVTLVLKSVRWPHLVCFVSLCNVPDVYG